MSVNDNADEENLDLRLPDINFPMLDHEQQIFTDIFEKDGLVILAKGLKYSNVICNLLWVYKDPGNLVLVINSNEHEEKYFSNKLGLKPLPITSAEREKAYLEGGIYMVSTRVLVVDLLRRRVPTSHVTGVLVLRAHTVLESCQEAFALRLYRQHNKTGFIKAFSSSPVSFTFGYHQVEKVMRALFVTELYLWPRFHGTVIKSLKDSNIRVEELRVPLTTAAGQMQACLLDIMNYTVGLLKKGHAHLDLQEVTAENCITKQFHKILASQLESCWHRMSAAARDLINDLKLLRTLLLELVQRDAVYWWNSAVQYQRAEYAATSSGWVLHPAADRLFTLAKKRLYNDKNEFDPEPCPKWKCLTDLIVKEIPDLVKRSPGEDLRSTNILVLCRDKGTCHQLHQVLTMGPPRYLLYTAMRLGVKVGSLPSHVQEDVQGGEQGDAQTEEAPDSAYTLTMTQAEDSDVSVFEPISQEVEPGGITLAGPVVTIQTWKREGDPFSLERCLESGRPRYVVMYHTDVAAVRLLEHHCAGLLLPGESVQGQRPPALYVLQYDGCVEEQTYLTSLRREKQAFTHLIDTKAAMIVPSYQDGKTDEYFTLDLEEDTHTTDTRKAGGQERERERERGVVVVDVREFRSELPALLHKRRLHVVPLTITVGDYVLTPEVCVERKAPADLASSLLGGRLYAQAVTLTRHYPRPVLLLELTMNHQGHALWGAEIIQKLQLLTLHFPRLKLVWSLSPYATAELFAELKQGRKNPDVAALTANATSAIEEPHTYNDTARDFLRRVPSVTSHTLHKLLYRAHSLLALANMSQEELSSVLENPELGKSLHSVLHTKLEPDRGKSAPGKYRPRH